MAALAVSRVEAERLTCLAGIFSGSPDELTVGHVSSIAPLYTRRNERAKAKADGLGRAETQQPSSRRPSRSCRCPPPTMTGLDIRTKLPRRGCERQHRVYRHRHLRGCYSAHLRTLSQAGGSLAVVGCVAAPDARGGGVAGPGVAGEVHPMEVGEAAGAAGPGGHAPLCQEYRLGARPPEGPGVFRGKRPSPVAGPTRRAGDNGGPGSWWWMCPACCCRWTASRCPLGKGQAMY